MAQAETASSTIQLTTKGERAAEQWCARQAAIADKRLIRATAAEEVERLLDLLDRLDGDPDLEPDGTEEDQSYPLSWLGRFQGSPMEDDEQDDEPEDDGTLEPSLGALENHPRAGWSADYHGEADQTRWGHSARQDLEQQCEGEGDEREMVL